MTPEIEALLREADELFQRHGYGWAYAELVTGLARELRAALADSERLNFLERGLMDGSYASIWNDIIAFCEVGYKQFGRGPSLRTAIDCQRETIDAARAGKD